MAKLPKQLQEQSDAVEALYSKPTDVPPAPTPPEQPEPVPAQPVIAAPEPRPQEQLEPRPEPPAPQAQPPEPPPVAPQEPQAKPQKDIWEQRYRTLQGMHNHNMDDMKRRLDRAMEENAALKERVASMEAAPAKPTVDPKLVETYGSEMVDMVNAIVQQQLGQRAPVAGTRNEKLDERVATVAQESARTAEEVFLWRVEQRVPDLKAVNMDQGFLDWLADPDPIYGATRQAALDSAAQARDVDRVVAIFEAYKRTVPSAPAPVPPAKAPSQLEKQAAPRAGVQPQAPVRQPGTTQTYKSGEVVKFYEDWRKGAYRGREAEAQQMEQEFNRALAEGRISP